MTPALKNQVRKFGIRYVKKSFLNDRQTTANYAQLELQRNNKDEEGCVQGSIDGPTF